MGDSADERVEHLADAISKAKVTDIPTDFDALSDDLDSEEPETKALPEHACAYCGIDDVNCVLQCLTCKRCYVRHTHTQVLQRSRANTILPYRHPFGARAAQGCHVASRVASR